jgi:hypothetical protein
LIMQGKGEIDNQRLFPEDVLYLTLVSY